MTKIDVKINETREGSGNALMYQLVVNGEVNNIYGTLAAAKLAAITVIAGS